jgi:hypothetical protein
MLSSSQTNTAALVGHLTDMPLEHLWPYGVRQLIIVDEPWAWNGSGTAVYLAVETDTAWPALLATPVHHYTFDLLGMYGELLVMMGKAINDRMIRCLLNEPLGLVVRRMMALGQVSADIDPALRLVRHAVAQGQTDAGQPRFRPHKGDIMAAAAGSLPWWQVEPLTTWLQLCVVPVTHMDMRHGELLHTIRMTMLGWGQPLPAPYVHEQRVRRHLEGHTSGQAILHVVR